ncbi:MAG: DNA-processing protein DprA [Acidimicrobiia bacterium]|nr:DNA-processing protein DprA [Acidimicrobiia bacterium]MDH4306457.1 DNA-processing protein DprA [Acidimicrobiia bacterium]
MSRLLSLALEGRNPDTVRKILASGSGWSGGSGGAEWPVPGVRFLESNALPPWLTDTPDAPPWLFARGELPDRPGVAVVGARRATRYGLDVAREVGRIVGGAGWPVVSGLALGVDGAAHEGALESGGTAVAVLGSGIDVWYPRRNRGLGERIVADGGAVVSEFGPGVEPEAWRFPYRNRIIAGLSSVVIVVEAAVRSGALITAGQALAQGRDVWAVPGDITRTTSRGCNMLIRDGAHPIQDLDDLVSDLELIMGPAPAGSVPPAGSMPATVEEFIGDRPVAEAMLELARLQATGSVVVTEGVLRWVSRRSGGTDRVRHGEQNHYAGDAG